MLAPQLQVFKYQSFNFRYFPSLLVLITCYCIWLSLVYMNVQGHMQPAVEMAAHTTLQLPGDTFDGGREYYALYIASAKGDLKAAKAILQDHEYLVRYSITPNMETPLHVAIMSKNTKFVEYLVKKMSKSDLEIKNSDGNTAFCLAAISGNVRMAEAMLLKNPTLLIICGSNSMMKPAIGKENETTPLCLAAFHGKREMVRFLYRRMKDDPSWTEHRFEVLLKCIEANMLDVARRILEDNKELPQDNQLRDVLWVLAQNPKVFPSPTIIGQIKSCLGISDGIKVLKLLLKWVAKKPKDMIQEILRGPVVKKDETETDSHILFIAAKMNNSWFLVEMFRQFPDLIWLRNDDGQTIFHIAVAHRHRDVYKLLLKSVGSMKDFITAIVDKKGNNILHMVGNIPQKIGFDDLETTPYEILCEYFWYKEVESTLSTRCTQVKNTEGNTPEEEFIKKHKEVISKGTDWIFETISQSMVVAALVCTIGFSIVYSLPGGFDQSGFPIFRESTTFIWFILVVGISFLLSATSMLIFISIILSRHGHHKDILFERWLAGQEALLASLATMVIAFLSSLFLLYRNNLLPYTISAIAIVLFAIYVEEYITFLWDGFYLTHRCMYLFRVKRYTNYFRR